MQWIEAVPPAELSEADLVRRARQRDAAAFRSIIQRHNQRLYRLVRSVVRDPVEAEDVVQETYVRAFMGLNEFRGASSFSTWLTRIAFNEALGRLRQRKPMTSLDEFTEKALEADDATVIPFPLMQPMSADPEHGAARAEIRRVLEQAIDELPAAFRVVFVMRAVEQLSTEETAAGLGIPEETVKTRFHRAKRRLRETIQDQLEGALVDSFPFAGARCVRIAERVLARLGLSAPPG